MTKFIVALLVLCIFENACMPVFFADKKMIKKDLLECGKKEKLKTVVNETDSTLTFLIRDSTTRPIDKIYYFNKTGFWQKTKLIADCDSCIQKYVVQILSDKKKEWIRVNANKYVSKFSEKLILEIHSDSSTPNSYILRKSNLSRKQYKSLLLKKDEV